MPGRVVPLSTIARPLGEAAAAFLAQPEFERDLIRERTSAGLAAARARGRHGG